MNKLLVLTLVTMIAQTSMAAPGRALETASKPKATTTAVRPLEKLAAQESIIKLEKKGINTSNLKVMLDSGMISADSLKTYNDMLDSSTVSPEAKSSIRNILEVLGKEKDVLGAKGKRLEAVETYRRFVTEIAPALLKEGNADVVELLTTAGSVVVKEGASVAIYRAVGKKFKIDGDQALAKINELKGCKI